MILIITASNDLHAAAVRQRLRELGYTDAHIIECDRLAQQASISYRVDPEANLDRLLTSEGREVRVADAKLIWLRRMRANQVLTLPIEDFAAKEIVDNDCRGGFSGFLATHFRGKWISDPEASIRSSDKIYQLKVAQRCGFRIPKTLVTQSRDDLEKFFSECDRKVIVKTVVGVSEPFLQTVRLHNPQDYENEAFEAAPAIYQEYIDGSEHLRLLCFGNKSLCGNISTEALDWRSNLNVAITPYIVSNELHLRVRRTLDELGLAMGVIDIKKDPRGEFIWLEVNPQGQFIFLEPLTGIGFINHFSNYLYEEALSA